MPFMVGFTISVSECQNGFIRTVFIFSVDRMKHLGVLLLKTPLDELQDP